MAKYPRITLELEGAGEIERLVETLRNQTDDINRTIQRIKQTTLDLQARINQPPKETDG